MGIYGELLGFSGLVTRGHGTPMLHRMWPYLDSLVILSKRKFLNMNLTVLLC